MGVLWGLREPCGVWEDPRRTPWGSYGVWGNPMGVLWGLGETYGSPMGSGGSLGGLMRLWEDSMGVLCDPMGTMRTFGCPIELWEGH